MLACGCSSGNPASKASTTPQETVTVAPGATVPFNAADNAHLDIQTSSCTKAAGAWVLHGTVKNPTESATAFQIVVDFVSEPGSTVLATTVVNVPRVAPGAKSTWSATGAKGKTDVGCIVRQAQTT